MKEVFVIRKINNSRLKNPLLVGYVKVDHAAKTLSYEEDCCLATQFANYQDAVTEIQNMGEINKGTGGTLVLSIEKHFTTN